MSTKCFHGVRFPKNRLGDFVDHVRPTYLLAAQASAEKFIKTISQTSKEYRETAKKHRKNQKAHNKHTRNCRSCLVAIAMKAYHEEAAASEPIMWLHLDCGMNVWLPKGRYALAHPWGGSLTDIKLPDWVESYGYWNSTDRPPSIGVREWKRREKLWESVLGPNAERRQLKIVGFDASKRNTIDLSWLCIRLHRGKAWGDPYGR